MRQFKYPCVYDCVCVPLLCDNHELVFYGPTAPTQSPTQVFTTDVQSESVMVHWTYDEFPRTGKLRAFQLNFYFPDEK